MGKEIKTQTETPCNMIKKKKSPLYLDNFLETLKSQWTIIASFIEQYNVPLCATSAMWNVPCQRDLMLYFIQKKQFSSPPYKYMGEIKTCSHLI